MPPSRLLSSRAAMILTYAFLCIAFAAGAWGLAQRIIFEFQIPYLNDNALFLTVGRGILNGLIPYRDLFETKPPAIFLLTALSLAAGGTFLARLLQVTVILLLVVLPPVTLLLRAKHDRAPLPLPLLALSLVFGLSIALYTGRQAGELFPESFGALFAALYAASLWHGARRWTWAHTLTAAIGMLGAIGFKEPFLFSLIAIALLLIPHPRTLFPRFFVPLAIAAATGAVILALLGYLIPYLTIYLPLMTDPYFSPREPLWLRGFAWDMLWKDVAGYSLPFALGLIALLFLRLRELAHARTWPKTILLFAGLGLLAYAMVKTTFAPPGIWARAGVMIALAAIGGAGFFVSAAESTDPKPLRFYRISAALVACWLLVLGPGTRGQFLPHHLVFAVPVYIGFFFLFVSTLRDHAAEEMITPHLRTGASLLFALSLLWHAPLADTERVRGFRAGFAELQAQAAEIDRILDACAWGRYLQIGGSHVEAYTRHSPLGPGFFQEKFNKEFPFFRETFEENLRTSPILILSGTAPSFAPEQQALLNAFRHDVPSCAGDVKMPGDVKVLFR